MRSKVIEILKNEMPEIDFEISETLVDDGYLDSFAVVKILDIFSREFNIQFDIDKITQDDFNSIDDMVNLIKKYSM